MAVFAAGGALLDGISAKRRSADLLLALPFIVLFFVQLLHHQMWRDELNAWGIAAASPNLRTLFHYIHYEAHPSLWYLLLWITSRFTAAPDAMKVTEGIIGVLIYLAIALWSPFARPEKALLFLSYFISFEYAVLSRMYGLCLLLLLLYLHRRVTRPHQVVGNAALLGVLANADMLGMILSFALLAEYGFDRLEAQGSSGARDRKRIYTAALVYFTLVGISVWTLMPASDLSWRTTGRMLAFASSLKHLGEAVGYYLVLPWWPINPGWPYRWWNFFPGLYALFLVPVVLSVYYLIFRHDRSLLLLIGVNAVSAIAFAHLIYLGATRHYGITFLAFLAALWIQQSRRSGISSLAGGLLLLSAVSGILAAIAQWHHPFSNVNNAADWLRQHRLGNAVLVGTPDTGTTGVAEELQRPMYFLDCSCSDRFVLYSNRRDNFRREQIPCRLKLAAEQLHAPEMILLMSYPLRDEEIKLISQQSLHVTPLARFTGAEMWEEDFYVYEVDKVPKSAI
ncbi:MAG: hypothetical protein JO028_04195 [Acidobacteriaceae bacterium]|nr:hypothetical protein [Acidobacteriaceae bacterium]